MRATAELAQALVNLRSNSDFKVFLEAVKEHEREETQRALTTDGVACHRAQGVALYCQTLQKLYSSAPADLEKVKLNQSRR